LNVKILVIVNVKNVGEYVKHFFSNNFNHFNVQQFLMYINAG